MILLSTTLITRHFFLCPTLCFKYISIDGANSWIHVGVIDGEMLCLIRDSKTRRRKIEVLNHLRARKCGSLPFSLHDFFSGSTGAQMISYIRRGSFSLSKYLTMFIRKLAYDNPSTIIIKMRLLMQCKSSTGGRTT
jgi:hypothetical protein